MTSGKCGLPQPRRNKPRKAKFTRPVMTDIRFCEHLGIHPPLRRPRPLPPRRQHLPPQTPFLNRGLRPRPLPHTPYTLPIPRRHHQRRPRRHPLPNPLHRQIRFWGPDPRRENRHLGNGQQRALRRAVSRPRVQIPIFGSRRGSQGRRRALHHAQRRRREILVQCYSPRLVPHSARRPRREASAKASTTPV